MFWDTSTDDFNVGQCIENFKNPFIHYIYVKMKYLITESMW